MNSPHFPDHTVESAPPESRRGMTATASHLGFMPAGMARMAASPELLNGFLAMSVAFEKVTLDPTAQEVVILTVAVRNSCHICVAMHSAKLAGLGADAGLIEALREGKPLPDDRLAAVQAFTAEVIDTAGAVPDSALEAFVGHGFTARNALEVVFGIGTYTMSTLANRMTKAPLDYQLQAMV